MNTLTFRQQEELRKMLGDQETERLIGMGFSFEKCIGEECVRTGEHDGHGSWESYLLSDPLQIDERQGNTKVSVQRNVPLRYWNFLIALAKNKSLADAVKWLKQRCLDANMKPVDMRAVLVFDTYSQIFKELNIVP